MKQILILLMAITFTCNAQQFIVGKYIQQDSAWLWAMAGVLSEDTIHHYAFSLPKKGIDGSWYTDAVNYIYFKFPNHVCVDSLPDNFFIKPDTTMH